MSYVIISPVRDEARQVERTLDSVVGQTVRPLRWVIVDDGSTDETPRIVERWARNHAFIQLITQPASSSRQPGGNVIRVFHTGYRQVASLEFDFVVKLDCDLSFGPDYFERLLGEFQAEPRLGIASGVYEECRAENDWRVVPMPAYHAAGAAKMIRRTCFAEIGGFVEARGWDTVDEIRAIARGWRTRHFPELVMRHWKPEGTGIGAVRTAVMHGEIYYLTGGSARFFLLKVLRRLVTPPVVLGALALVWGYLKLWLRRAPRLVTAAEARCYRDLLHARLKFWRPSPA